MKTCAGILLLVLAPALALPALAQEASDDWLDRVVVSAVDPFIAYPAASVSRRDLSTVYEIDMATVLHSARGASVAMTWTLQGTAHEICFEHEAERRCRLLETDWNPDVQPRFKPTKSDHWPTIYASFTNLGGQASLVVYAGGSIKTREEEIAELRASLDN